MTTGELVLRGERTRLRPLLDSDVAPLTTWLNDPDVRYWLHHSDREDATEDDFREVYMAPDRRQLVFAIEAEDGSLIGVTRLIDIDRTHGRGEIAIIIGDKTAWSRGYGTDVLRAFLRHTFEAMGLRRVQLITDADNARGIRCYEKAGFVHEGRLRQHRVRYGEPIDMVVMSVLRKEWETRRQEQVLRSLPGSVTLGRNGPAKR